LGVLVLFRILQVRAARCSQRAAILNDTFPLESADGVAVYGIAVVVAPTIGRGLADGLRTIFVALDFLHQHSGGIISLLLSLYW